MEEKNIENLLDKSVVLGGEISFCYIDGNHKYDFVKRDFLNVSKILEIGGFILFDDSFDGSNFGSGMTLMREIRADKRFKLISKNPNYLFKKVKK